MRLCQVSNNGEKCKIFVQLNEIEKDNEIGKWQMGKWEWVWKMNSVCAKSLTMSMTMWSVR